MIDVHLDINRHLFAAYCGLLRAGYDLYDDSDSLVQFVTERLPELHMEPELTPYFARAKTGRIAVNPYYPWGNDMGAACFFLNDPPERFRQFLQECGSPDAEDAAFLPWIAKLTEALAQIEGANGFETLFQEYARQLSARCKGVEAEIEEVRRRLKECLGAEAEICFAPNPLQSPFQTDFVRRDGLLTVIAARFDRSSVIHEALHPFVAKHRSKLQELLDQRGIDAFVDRERMREYGYMPEDTSKSCLHALEECVVRALCGAVDETIDRKAYGEWNRRQGFIAVETMMEKLK